MANLEVLRIGSSGAAVKKWQYFLVGQAFYHGEVDGDFGPRTQEATIDFQKAHALQPDGIVGNKCYGTAMLLGFGIAVDPLGGKQSSEFPPKPNFNPLVSDDDRRSVFGKFSYVHAPLPREQEHIRVTDDWYAKNIVSVPLPQLGGVAGISKVSFHKIAAGQMEKLWRDWENAGLLHLVITWGGTYNPRFIRGSRTKLSNHAFGSAFDINVAWNQLGAVPALVGQKGTVRELVQIANENGFYWGGHFTRLDGMHFEIARIL
jgi:hypothetical protein